MKQILLIIAGFALMLSSNNVLAQQRSDDCELYVVDADLKKEVMLEKFTTEIGEEVLTNKSFPLSKTGLVVTVSVYYTDESMASKHGTDSMMLGVAVSRKALPNAFTATNNAFAEVTLATFDVARAKTYYKVNSKNYLIGVQCSNGTNKDIQ